MALGEAPVAAARGLDRLVGSTHGISVGARAEIHDMIARLAADGTTVLIASSELPQILSQAFAVPAPPPSKDASHG